MSLSSECGGCCSASASKTASPAFSCSRTMRRNSPIDQPSRNISGKPTRQQRGERNQPDDHRDRHGRLLFYSKDQRQHKNAAGLRAAADARQLRHRADYGEREDEKRAGKIERRECPPKA